MKLVFATHNQGKLREVQRLMPPNLKLLSLRDIGCHDDIPETGETLEENALAKAQHIKFHYGYDCFADDTGLLVYALNGAPGVHSARYAGPDRDSNENMDKLLREMEGIANRKARFKTVIALILGEKELLFTGIAEGKIIHEKRGTEGFGYDPVFVPEGDTRSFAQMSLSEKNEVSHRARAFSKLISYLGTISVAHEKEINKPALNPLIKGTFAPSLRQALFIGLKIFVERL